MLRIVTLLFVGLMSFSCAKECPECYGTGSEWQKVSCSSCSGSGKATTKEKCSKCYGAGENSCSYRYDFYRDGFFLGGRKDYYKVCSGGKLDTWQKSKYKDFVFESQTEVCSSCNGRGFLKCSDCAGSGKVEVQKEQCASCSGSGQDEKRIRCSRCDGEGKL